MTDSPSFNQSPLFDRRLALGASRKALVKAAGLGEYSVNRSSTSLEAGIQLLRSIEEETEQAKRSQRDPGHLLAIQGGSELVDQVLTAWEAEGAPKETDSSFEGDAQPGEYVSILVAQFAREARLKEARDADAEVRDAERERIEAFGALVRARHEAQRRKGEVLKQMRKDLRLERSQVAAMMQVPLQWVVDRENGNISIGAQERLLEVYQGLANMREQGKPIAPPVPTTTASRG
jgi:DNA-binding transcriptional regulator YiaG